MSKHSKKKTFQRLYLEVIHSDSKWVHDFSINGLILKVDQVHLLSDGLQGSLRAEGSQICTHVSMSLIGYLHTRYRDHTDVDILTSIIQAPYTFMKSNNEHCNAVTAVMRMHCGFTWKLQVKTTTWFSLLSNSIVWFGVTWLQENCVYGPVPSRHRQPVSCSWCESGESPICQWHQGCRCPLPYQNALERVQTHRLVPTKQKHSRHTSIYFKRTAWGRSCLHCNSVAAEETFQTVDKSYKSTRLHMKLIDKQGRIPFLLNAFKTAQCCENLTH